MSCLSIAVEPLTCLISQDVNLYTQNAENYYVQGACPGQSRNPLEYCDRIAQLAVGHCKSNTVKYYLCGMVNMKQSVPIIMMTVTTESITLLLAHKCTM